MSYLVRVLDHFVRTRPAAAARGLALECDPGTASLYVHIDVDGRGGDPLGWRCSYFEQEVPDLSAPRWFPLFDELCRRHASGELGSRSELGRAFETILEGVADALVELRDDGRLAERGLVPTPELSLVTEDDESEATGRARIASHDR